jgi:hypothetical protein
MHSLVLVTPTGTVPGIVVVIVIVELVILIPCTYVDYFAQLLLLHGAEAKYHFHAFSFSSRASVR